LIKFINKVFRKFNQKTSSKEILRAFENILMLKSIKMARYCPKEPFKKVKKKSQQ
jgi:hypothetical protein